MENNILQEDEIVIDLSVLIRDFIKGVIKFWWLLLVMMLLGAMILFSFNYLTYTPKYLAKATFTVTTTNNQTNSNNYTYNYDSNTAEQLSLTFPYILNSDILNDAIRADLQVDDINGTIDTSIVSDSNMITMSVTSDNSDDALAILQSTIKLYPTVARYVIGMTRFNMIENPNVTTNPYNQPNYFMQSIMGAGIGLFAGLTIIALMALFKKTIHKTEQLEEITNLKCLATIPYIKQKKRNKLKLPTILDKPNNPIFKENFESLHIRMIKELNRIHGKTIIVTSTMPNEGKSTVAINLAYSLAKNDKKVLLIDGDLRKQNLANQMNIKTNGIGLQEIKQGSDYLIKNLNYLSQNIYYLGGNHPVDDATVILTNKNLKDFIDKMNLVMDYIIIDSPPCYAFEDVLLMEEYGDAFVYVIKQDYVTKNQIADGISMLSECSIPILGYVFNGDNYYQSYGYYGRYGYNRYGYYARNDQGD